MARIRTIKPEFWTSEQVVEMTMPARLCFLGLLNFSDDGGNHPASPKTLKMEVFPGDDITSGQVAELISEMIQNGLVVEYTGQDGRQYWHVTGFTRHQKVERPSYKHPEFDDQSSNDRRTIVERHPPEGKGKESNSNNSPSNARAHTREEPQADVEAEKAPSPPVPPAPPPPSDLPGVCAAAQAWCESNPEQVRFWRETSRYTGDPLEQIPRFFSYYWGERSREHRARSEPLDFFQNKFLSWLTNEKHYTTTTTNPPKNGKATYQRPSTGRANGYEDSLNRTAIAELLLERHGISLDPG